MFVGNELLESRPGVHLGCDCIEPADRDLRCSYVVVSVGVSREGAGFASPVVVGRRLGRHPCFLPFDGCRPSASPCQDGRKIVDFVRHLATGV
jgi:hypothetical protein